MDMDARQLRIDLEALREEVAHALHPVVTMPEHTVCKTATQTTYPTTANAYYYCDECRVGGDETEGGAGTVTALTGRHLTAYNIGSAIPPVGTSIIVHAKDGRFTFNYCGTA